MRDIIKAWAPELIPSEKFSKRHKYEMERYIFRSICLILFVKLKKESSLLRQYALPKVSFSPALPPSVINRGCCGFIPLWVCKKTYKYLLPRISCYMCVMVLCLKKKSFNTQHWRQSETETFTWNASKLNVKVKAQNLWVSCVEKPQSKDALFMPHCKGGINK